MSHIFTQKQQYWSEILASADSSGLSLTEFAAANQLKPQQLYRWRNQLKKYTEKPATQFTQVVASHYSLTPSLSIEIASAHLQFDTLPDAQWLAKLLSLQGHCV